MLDNFKELKLSEKSISQQDKRNNRQYKVKKNKRVFPTALIRLSTGQTCK